MSDIAPTWKTLGVIATSVIVSISLTSWFYEGELEKKDDTYLKAHDTHITAMAQQKRDLDQECVHAEFFHRIELNDQKILDVDDSSRRRDKKHGVPDEELDHDFEVK